LACTTAFGPTFFRLDFACLVLTAPSPVIMVLQALSLSAIRTVSRQLAHDAILVDVESCAKSLPQGTT
jgi:hypothetical protein